MSIVRDNPFQTTYDLYSDPYRLAEFRLFSLNKCEMSCRGCFYNRLNNTYDDFKSMYELALDLKRNDYQLETLYLLPTEFFENDVNYDILKNHYVRETIRKFNYLGIAATLEAGYDKEFFSTVYEISDRVNVELQVNLSIKRIFDRDYTSLVRKYVLELKERYGERIVINLAINTGFKITKDELSAIRELSNFLSEDAIVELNFTFLFNDAISTDKKKTMLAKAFEQVNSFKDYYSKHPSYVKQYNDRTLLRKPSFTFLGTPNRIYVNPILPFDEYVFVDREDLVLEEPTFDSFLSAIANSDESNIPILDKCYECDDLTYCMGKHYFSIARHYSMGCHNDISINEELMADEPKKKPSVIHLIKGE